MILAAATMGQTAAYVAAGLMVTIAVILECTLSGRGIAAAVSALGFRKSFVAAAIWRSALTLEAAPGVHTDQHPLNDQQITFGP
jgi:hypothetical protein